jgi:PAS domain S-box-containing protein
MKNQTEERPCKNPILKHQSQIRTHEKLYPILEVSLDLLCSIDRHGHFVSVNNSAERILDYTREELTGMKYSSIIHSEDRYKTGAIANEIISGRKVNDFENRYLRKDGSIVDLMWAATWNEEDQLLYCVARDISELKKAQEALLKSNERFYYATKATSDAVWEWDLKTNQLLWGENYYSLFGYHPELENNHISNWYVRVHPSDCERVVKSINMAIETGVEIWTEEYRYKKADGCYVWVLNKGIILKRCYRPGLENDWSNARYFQSQIV